MADPARAAAVTHLRAAVPGDAGAIAAFHVAVWRATYAALAPPAAIAALDTRRRLAAWEITLAASVGTTLAYCGDDLVGLVCHGPATHPAFGPRGEIRHLYVGLSHQGRGLGRQLLRNGINALRESGFQGVALAVVAENHAARAFYRHCGGVEVGAFTDPGPLWRSDNIVVAWDR